MFVHTKDLTRFQWLTISMNKTGQRSLQCMATIDKQAHKNKVCMYILFLHDKAVCR